MLLPKTTLSLLIVCSVAATAVKQSACHNQTVNQPIAKDTANLGQMLDLVQKELDDSKEILDRLNVEICEEQVSFQVTRTNIENADFEVLLKASGKRTGQKQTTMTFDLKRPAPVVDKEKAHLIKVLPTATLSQIIIAAARQYAAVKDNLATGLKKNNFSIDIVVSIEYDANLGFSFKLFGNGADLGAELDNAVQHEIVLTFAEKGKCP